MSDVIEFEDIFGKDAFEKGVQGVEKITQAFKDMSAQLSIVATEQKEFISAFKTNNSGDIKRLNDELAKANKTILELNNANKAAAQGERELAQIRIANAKAVQEEEKAAQQKLKTEKASNQTKEKTLTLYQQESKLLRELKNEYKEVALAQGQTSKAAQDLLSKITPLDAKLKALDKTTGDNFRNVGNYSSALEGFGTSVKNILGAGGIFLGAAEGITFLKESFAEFQNAEKATKELGFALTNIGGEGTAALVKLSDQASELEDTLGLFEGEDIQALQKQLVNLGASSSQVEKLTPKILDLAKATGMDLASATDVAVKAINGQTKGLKEVGLEFQDTGNRTDNYNILLEKLDKFQGAAANSAETLEGKQQRIAIAWGNVKEAVGEYLTTSASQLLDSFDALTGKISLFDLGLKQLTTGYAQQAQELIKNNEAQKAYVFWQNEAKKIQDSDLSPEEKEKALKLITAQTKELTKAIEDNNRAAKRNQNQFLNNNLKSSGGIEVDASGKSTGTYEEAILKAQEELLKDQELLDYEYDKAKKERDQQQRDEDFAAAQKEVDRLNDLEDKARLEQEKKDKEAADKLAKQREEELKNLFEAASKALDIAEKEIKEKEKLREDAINKEIDDRQRSIEEQKRRAEEGLSNTLAFEEKALKDAEAKKEEENKKALKREKALTFFKLLSANAEKDPNTALQKTITEILLGEAIAGAFFKGTENVAEDLKGNKVHNGRDGYVVAVDGSERVLTGEQNKLIGKMSNEELAQLAHDYNNNKLLPNYMLNEGVNSSSADKIYASMQLNQLVKMNERLESLEEAIKNKPVSNTNIDGLGYIIREEIRNGLKTTTKTPLTRGY